jgi:hypothetical protein
MNKIIYILIVSIIFINSPVFAYESSKQVKLDSVNSYQPMQFVSGNALLDKKKRESVESEAKSSQASYMENMPISEGYVSKSPIAKEEDETTLPVADFSEDTALEGSALAQEKPKNQLSKRQKWDNACTWVKGKPSSDALLLGMWSKHVVTKDRNEKNELMAFQYGGIAAGYFKNSWYKDTYFLTVARTPWTKKFKNDLSIDFQYKAGVMHGYEDHAPLRVGYVEAFIMPAFAFNYKTSGFDIWVVPNPVAPVFAFNFRVGIPDKLTYQSVHARVVQKYPPKPKTIEAIPVNQYDQIQKEPSAQPAL